MKQQKFSTANEKQYTVLGYVITSTSDLQPSTTIVNQSLGKSASTNLNHSNATMGPAHMQKSTDILIIHTHLKMCSTIQRH